MPHHNLQALNVRLQTNLPTVGCLLGHAVGTVDIHLPRWSHKVHQVVDAFQHSTWLHVHPELAANDDTIVWSCGYLNFCVPWQGTSATMNVYDVDGLFVYQGAVFYADTNVRCDLPVNCATVYGALAQLAAANF